MGMNARRNGLMVLAIQLAVVLSIGVKYAWERHHCPMVWTRAGQYDPSGPIRGRYIALTLHASACGLPEDQQSWAVPAFIRNGAQVVGARQWRVVPAVKDGKLAPRVVSDTQPGPTQQLTLPKGADCSDARLDGTSDFFIPEHAKSPFPLKEGAAVNGVIVYQQLWALVTVPPSGPVRPVELAVSDATGWHVLKLD
jgi:hypothetical protein